MPAKRQKANENDEEEKDEQFLIERVQEYTSQRRPLIDSKV